MKKPLLLAHRGYWEIAPENTELSFTAAKLFGFDGVEMDVHQTKDNKLVVIHDETIKRTGDGNGRIEDFTLAELRKINFTYKFDNALPFQKIMTFEEFLKKYSDAFKVINVEIKTDIIQYKGIEKRILDVHKKMKPKAQIIYSSFNFESLKRLRQLDKKVEIGFLFVDSNDIKDIIPELKKTCQYIHPWFKSMVKAKDLAVYKKTGLKMNLWTFDKRVMGDEWSDGSYKLLSKILKIKNIYSLISNSKIY